MLIYCLSLLYYIHLPDSWMSSGAKWLTNIIINDHNDLGLMQVLRESTLHRQENISDIIYTRVTFFSYHFKFLSSFSFFCSLLEVEAHVRIPFILLHVKVEHEYLHQQFFYQWADTTFLASRLILIIKLSLLNLYEIFMCFSFSNHFCEHLSLANISLMLYGHRKFGLWNTFREHIYDRMPFDLRVMASNRTQRGRKLIAYCTWWYGPNHLWGSNWIQANTAPTEKKKANQKLS